MASGSTSPKADGTERSLSPDSLAAGEVKELLAKADSAEVSSTTGGTSSRREVLLKQLRDIEAAIARKKKTTA